MSPEDLLQMARSTRALRDMLMAKSAKSIWRAAWSASDVPEPPLDFCEPLYASLIFDKFCLVRFTLPVTTRKRANLTFFSCVLDKDV